MLLSDATLPSGLTYTPDGFTTWAGCRSCWPTRLSAALGAPRDPRPGTTRPPAVPGRGRHDQRRTADVQRSLVAAPDPLWAPRSTFLRQTLRALDQAPYARIVTLQAAARQATDVARTRVLYPGPTHRRVVPRLPGAGPGATANGSPVPVDPQRARGAGLRTGRHAADLSGVAR